MSSWSNDGVKWVVTGSNSGKPKVEFKKWCQDVNEEVLVVNNNTHTHTHTRRKKEETK